MFTWWNGEFERAVGKVITLGVSGSYITLDEDNETYAAGNLFSRYYPQGAALVGFFFGVRGGVYAVEDKNTDESGSAYGFGIDIGYTWLLGANRNFGISAGIGAVRLFGGDVPDGSATTLPTIRLVNIGYAF